MKTFKQILGERIRDARITAGFATQKDLADALETDQSRVSRWESGEAKPGKRFMKLMVSLFKIKETDLTHLDTEISRPAKAKSGKLTTAQLREIVEHPERFETLELANILVTQFLDVHADARGTSMGLLFENKALSLEYGPKHAQRARPKHR